MAAGSYRCGPGPRQSPRRVQTPRPVVANGRRTGRLKPRLLCRTSAPQHMGRGARLKEAKRRNEVPLEGVRADTSTHNARETQRPYGGGRARRLKKKKEKKAPTEKQKEVPRAQGHAVTSTFPTPGWRRARRCRHKNLKKKKYINKYNGRDKGKAVARARGHLHSPSARMAVGAQLGKLKDK
ncbi:hypothetical protein NDU88_002811 [Pleurodeles waltl]|uniref:Uncharacterized protein n=1 Tax=Pleurodeles waltl TaxID=8319 RepID=A0AAV7LEU2_PLEWA|nr:hypothetical protein NDU88_002811 [Pleurodeles waltl]